MEKNPKCLWIPSEDVIKNSNISKYMGWLSINKDLTFEDYHSLWKWSVDDLPAFWESIFKYFQVISYRPYDYVISDDPMPETKWFHGSALNYSEHIFKNKHSESPAIIYGSEHSSPAEITWEELEKKVAAFQQFLINKGITKGDRVVAFIPNIPEATIAFLAVNSIGAVWSSCSPDFGTSSVIDRFAQIKPKILITVDGYQYGGKSFNKKAVIAEVLKNLPTIKETVWIPYLDPGFTPDHQNATLWQEALNNITGELKFTPVPFEHPIWILFSSGTTGIPKAITHGNGGVLLEHLKYLAFHNDVKPGERCFWYTTTGWMMWNYIQASMLVGGTVVLYDGSPVYPDVNVLWKFTEDVKITHFGSSAGYIVANMKAGTHPGKEFNLASLRSLGSTGSPLPPEGFDWVYKEIKEDLWLVSISGGTDVCSAFVGGVPLWPVYSGEIQCRALGCSLEAYNEDGKPILNEVGEMVITKPMPSMPVYFWNDKNFERYKSSYFDTYPGVWRHGDWTEITSRHGVIIYGRSDSTLNRGGVRIGTSEVYRAVDKISEVKDSLIICIEKEGGEYFMPLFVVLNKDIELDRSLIDKINQTIRSDYSPRHVPDKIIEIDEVPYTISGKKVETPVKKILMGTSIEEASNTDALKNPESLNFFTTLKY